MRTFNTLMMAVACCAILVQPALVIAEGREVTVRLPSMVSRSAAAIRAMVRIPRDPDNRVLRVTLESGAFYRSSDVPLEGDRAPRTHLLEWQALPVGAYEVTIQLFGTERVKQVIRRQLQVIGLE